MTPIENYDKHHLCSVQLCNIESDTLNMQFSNFEFSPQFLVHKLPNLQLLFFEFFLFILSFKGSNTTPNLQCKIQWAISQKKNDFRP